MRKFSKLFALAAIAAALFASCGTPKKTGAQAKAQEGYDVYLLIGQSNMAGRGKMLPQDTLKAIEGVYLLGADDKPVPAKNPLNQYSTVRKTIKMQQICPGTAFSEEMYAHNGRKILIVMNARGGTTLSEWVEGTQYYNEAVRRCREGLKYGKLKGILWHQGCGDSSPSKTAVYLDKLAPMVASLRRDLGVGTEVPFIAGELAHWRKASGGFNEMIHGISGRIPNSGWVSAEDCGPLKPESLGTDKVDPHFSRDGQLLLGKRYAEKMIEMQNR